MKTAALLLSLFLVFTGAISQTSLQGKVTDENNSQPIIFGTVALYKNGVLITGTETDFDGFYSITELDPGTYNVEFSYTGFQTMKIEGVVVSAGKANKLDVKLSSGITLSEVVVTYQKPLVENDITTCGQTLTSEDIRGMPKRNVNDLSSLSAGTSKGRKKTKGKKVEGGDDLPIRGSRSDATNYYIDGIRVNPSNQPPAFQNPEGFQALGEFNTEDYAVIVENEFKSPLQEPLSTFSIDVDKASYSNIRRYLNMNQLPPPDAVRIEEMVNYFDYVYEKPKGEIPFSVYTELAPCLWSEGNLLLHIGLKGRELDMKDASPSNLVFLIDVSGSMETANKLELVKPAFRLLVNQLRAADKVAIVVYAGAAGLVLPSTPGNEKEAITAAINRLQAGGSTAGAAGIQLAYQVAKENFIEGGNNRVILATDGDFNVGVSSDGDLMRLIEEKRKDGIFLTALGFGYGNLKDNKLEILADKGNGNYAYIDNLLEAKKAFVTDLTGTLFTIAKDVKIQIEFNPAVVQAYRLVGYENRLLAKEDFNDDTKDAGEIGAGHTVTALYEIVPRNKQFEFAGEKVDTLKYQSLAFLEAANAGEMLTLKLRYKEPDGDTSRLISQIVENRWAGFPEASENFRWATAVAGFGMLLRDSKFKGELTYDKILEIGKRARGKDKNGYRAECLKLVETTGLLKEAKLELQAEKK